MEKVMYYYHHKVYMGDRPVHEYFRCPYCGLIADKDERPTWVYCPSCGAKVSADKIDKSPSVEPEIIHCGGVTDE